MYKVEELLEIIEGRLTILNQEFGVPEIELAEIMNYVYSLRWAQKRESFKEIRDHLDKL